MFTRCSITASAIRRGSRLDAGLPGHGPRARSKCEMSFGKRNRGVLVFESASTPSPHPPQPSDFARSPGAMCSPPGRRLRRRPRRRRMRGQQTKAAGTGYARGSSREGLELDCRPRYKPVRCSKSPLVEIQRKIRGVQKSRSRARSSCRAKCGSGSASGRAIGCDMCSTRMGSASKRKRIAKRTIHSSPSTSGRANRTMKPMATSGGGCGRRPVSLFRQVCAEAASGPRGFRTSSTRSG
jgi:hypothetical protein